MRKFVVSIELTDDHASLGTGTHTDPVLAYTGTELRGFYTKWCSLKVPTLKCCYLLTTNTS